MGLVPAGDHRVAQDHPVRAERRGLLFQWPVDLRAVPHGPRASRQMPSGGEAQRDHRLGVHAVALTIGAHVVDGRQQLPLGDGPPGLGGHVVVQHEHRVAQSGETQRHRLTLPVGAERIAAAGTDDQRRAGAAVQLRGIVGNI